jgi:hypothetical protein
MQTWPRIALSLLESLLFVTWVAYDKSGLAPGTRQPCGASGYRRCIKVRIRESIDATLTLIDDWVVSQNVGQRTRIPTASWQLRLKVTGVLKVFTSCRKWRGNDYSKQMICIRSNQLIMEGRLANRGDPGKGHLYQESRDRNCAGDQ